MGKYLGTDTIQLQITPAGKDNTKLVITKDIISGSLIKRAISHSLNATNNINQTD